MRRGATLTLCAACLGTAATGVPAQEPPQEPTAEPLEEPLQEPTAPVYTLVPFGGTRILYLRYGAPGGVRITSRTGVTADTAAAEPAAVVRPTPEAAEASLRARIRALVREELRRHDERRRVAVTEPAYTARAEPPDAAPREARTLLDAEPGKVLGAAPDEPMTAQAPEPPRVEPEGTTIIQHPADIEPAVIRDRLLDRGLLRTNLIIFETNTTTLSPRSRDVIETIGEALGEIPEAEIRIEGHADPRGPAEHNLELSRARADAVRDYLIDCCGVDPDRLTTAGYGESRPLVTGGSATDLALNRRVEFRVMNPGVLEDVPRRVPLRREQ